MSIIYVSNYNTTKTQVQSALTKVGASFTWTSSVGSGTVLTASQVQELVNAVKTADSSFMSCSDSGCSGYHSHEGHDTDYGKRTDNSHDNSDDSYDRGDYGNIDIG